MKKPELLSDKAGEASGYDLQQKVKILKRTWKDLFKNQLLVSQ